jgi:hypothetical protein
MIPVSPGTPDPSGSAEVMRLLTPVAHELADAIADPPAVAAHDWIGPASEACRRQETELRVRLVTALVELDRVLALARSAS